MRVLLGAAGGVLEWIVYPFEWARDIGKGVIL